MKLLKGDKLVEGNVSTKVANKTPGMLLSLLTYAESNLHRALQPPNRGQ